MNRMMPTTPKDAHVLAAAIGRDAANQQMRRAGRSAWNVDDANLAADTMGEMYGVFGILNARQWLPPGWTWTRDPDGNWQPVTERICP